MTREREKRGGKARRPVVSTAPADYGRLVSDISGLLEEARRRAVRAVNSVLTATYWEIGRRIVEFEQGGQARAAYGEELLIRLSADLTAKHGRGFSDRNLRQMRTFYLGWEIWQTPSAKSGQALLPVPAPIPQGIVPVDVFPLSWSHYVHLMSVENPRARAFYESEAIRGGWSVRQLDRQISTQFYQRTVRSKNRSAMLALGQEAAPLLDLRDGHLHVGDGLGHGPAEGYAPSPGESPACQRRGCGNWQALYNWYNTTCTTNTTLSTPGRGRERNDMLQNAFGEYIRVRRAALRLSLRSFAEKAGLDAGNASRLERGRVAPPEKPGILDRIASALELRGGSPEYQQLIDLAAAAKGRIPQDLLTDEEVAARLPILFRTLRGKPLSGEQLEKLIDSIRRA